MDKRTLFIIFLGILTSCYLFHSTAFAQSANAPQLLVTPSIIKLDLSVDKPEAILTYKNLTDSPMELSFQAQDFKELEDGYKLTFLEGKDANNYQYGLSSWVQFSSKTLLLNAYEKAQLTVFIQKDKLSPGAHYATILASVSPRQTTNQSVIIKGILGSLLFVRTNTGVEKESANIDSFELARDFFGFPKTIYFRFNNTGDTDLTPYGLIQIMSGNALVAKGIVNETSAPTLPQSIRRYYVPIRQFQNFLWPGIYTAKLSLHYGKSDQKITKTISFFSEGSIPLMLIGVLVFVFAAVMIYWKKRKLKNLER